MNPDNTGAARTARRAGFRQGLDQPCTDVALRFHSPASIDYTAVDEWLVQSFGVTLAPHGGLPGQLSEAADEAVAFAWRTMHLAAALMRAIKVPVFGACRVLAVQAPSAGDPMWTVTAAVPQVDLMPARAYDAALEAAGRSLSWMARRGRTPETIEKLFTTLDSGFIQTLRPLVGGGESTMPVLQTAVDMRIPFRHLGSGIYQLGWGSAALRVDRGAVQFDSSIGARMVQDKALAASVIRDAGLPAPVHRRVNTEQEALAAAHAIGWPVVVKPVDRERGEGVTVGVDSDDKVKQGFAHALSFSRRVLVERQVEGICHRIVVAGDKVMLVGCRLPKSVWGDGQHTVEQLVARANAEQQAKPPWERLKPFPLDATALQCLASVNLTPQSLPAQGVLVPLRLIQSTQEGGVADYFTETVHPDNVDAAVRSARLFGLSVAGVDMISPDITKPWHENGAILNEVNFSSLLPNRTSAHVLPSLIRQFIPGDARIPVDMVLGEGPDVLEAAKRMQAERVAAGLRCFLADPDATLAPDASAVPFAGSGLFARCMALVFDERVDAIVVAVRSDEFLRTGLPLDRITRLHVLPARAPAWVEAMRALMQPYLAAESI